MLEPTKQEAKWMKRLAKLTIDQPPNTEVFLDGDWLYLLRTNPDGSAILAPDGAASRDAIIDSVGTIRWNAGMF